MKNSRWQMVSPIVMNQYTNPYAQNLYFHLPLCLCQWNRTLQKRFNKSNGQTLPTCSLSKQYVPSLHTVQSQPSALCGTPWTLVEVSQASPKQTSYFQVFHRFKNGVHTNFSANIVLVLPLHCHIVPCDSPSIDYCHCLLLCVWPHFDSLFFGFGFLSFSGCSLVHIILDYDLDLFTVCSE